MGKYIDEKIELLDERGFLKDFGYSYRMVFDYNRNKIKTNLFSLKEWDFYQIKHQDYIIQMTFGHISYAANFSFNIFNIKTGIKISISKIKLFPFQSLNMPEDPDKNTQLFYKDKEFNICFTINNYRRILDFNFKGYKEKSQNKIYIEVQIELFNKKDENRIVIVTPFEKKNQFYLNCKENFFNIAGKVNIDDIVFDFDSNDTAVLDWGRGVWPYKHQWFWGNGAAVINNNRFAFNLGWGFGSDGSPKENIYFLNGKPYKIENLKYDIDLQNYMNKWHFYDEEGKLDLEMTPIFDNYTKNKLLIVNTKCHQVWGYFNGYVKSDNGKKININNLLAFCEHAINRW